MDDFWFFTLSYEEARAHQDATERFLYSDALGLGGEKTRIRKVETALRDTEPAEARIQRRREDLTDDYLASIDGEYIDVDAVDLPEAEIEAAAHD